MAKYTINEIKELLNMGFTHEQIAQMCNDGKSQPKAETKTKVKSSGKATKGKGKSQPKAEPITRAEAIAKWKADKGITPESEAKFKALFRTSSEFYKKHWDARANDPEYIALVKEFGKSVANSKYHNGKMKELCADESKK